MSAFRRGRRCDWCGKVTSDPAGEYLRPNGEIGFIAPPDDDKAGTNDICDECVDGVPADLTPAP